MRQIARDYLAIQGSATLSERAFSSGGITGCAQRNRLHSGVFEGLQLLKSAYHNGHMSEGSQATQHMEVFMRSFADNDNELDHISSS